MFHSNGICPVSEFEFLSLCSCTTSWKKWQKLYLSHLNYFPTVFFSIFKTKTISNICSIFVPCFVPPTASITKIQWVKCSVMHPGTAGLRMVRGVVKAINTAGIQGCKQYELMLSLWTMIPYKQLNGTLS